MKKCPKCNSNNIYKERYQDITPNAFCLGGTSAYNETGDLVCNQCKFTSSSDDFR